MRHLQPYHSDTLINTRVAMFLTANANFPWVSLSLGCSRQSVLSLDKVEYRPDGIDVELGPVDSRTDHDAPTSSRIISNSLFNFPIAYPFAPLGCDVIT